MEKQIILNGQKQHLDMILNQIYVMFPAQLRHQVMPYTPNATRICVR